MSGRREMKKRTSSSCTASSLKLSFPWSVCSLRKRSKQARIEEYIVKEQHTVTDGSGEWSVDWIS